MGIDHGVTLRRIVDVDDTRETATRLDVRHIASAVRRRIGLVVTIAAIGTLIAAVAAFSVPRRYTATLQIGVGTPGAETSASPLDDSLVDTHWAMLTSDSQLRRVAARISKPTEPQAHDADPGSSHKVTTAYLRKGLKVYQERRSRVIVVEFTDDSPVRAAEVANIFAETHIASLRQRQKSESERVLEHLTSQLAITSKDVEQAQSRLQAYRIAHGLGAADNTDLDSIADTERQLGIARAEEARQRALLERIRALRSSASPDAGAAILRLLDDPYQPSDSDAGPGSPAASEPQPGGSAVIPEQRSALASAVTGATTRLEAQSEIVHSQVRQLEERLRALRSAAKLKLDEKAHLELLERQASSASKTLDELVHRRQEVSDRVVLSPIDARILSVASVPDKPSSVEPVLLLPPALFAFSLLGCAIAFTLDRRDTSMRSPAAISEWLGIACAGVLPGGPAKSRRAHPFTALEAGSPFGQAIRSIVAASLYPGNGRAAPKIILVTSSSAGEGGTMLASSFAACVAGLGRSVALLDLSSAPQAAASPSPAPAFPCLHAGDIGLEPGSLERERIAAALAGLRHAHDCVVILSPPVLSVTVSHVLVSLADRVLLAVRYGATRREDARLALRLLREASLLEGTPPVPIAAVMTRADAAASLARDGDGARSLFFEADRLYGTPPPTRLGEQRQDRKASAG